MTKEELVKAFRQLPLDERKAFAEEVLRNIREDVQANGLSMNSDGQRHTIEEKVAAVDRLRGLFKSRRISSY